MTYIDSGYNSSTMTDEIISDLEATYPAEFYTVVIAAVYTSEGYLFWESNALVAPHAYAEAHPPAIKVPATIDGQERPEKGYLRIQINDGTNRDRVMVIGDWAEDGKPLVWLIPDEDQAWNSLIALDFIASLKG